MDPARGHVPAEVTTLRVAPDLALPLSIWRSAAPRVAIALLHGLGEHAGRYHALASALVDAGATVVALDLPGHGRATGPRGHLPWERVRDEAVTALLAEASARTAAHGALPRVLFGHSMGGVLALDHALAHPEGLAGLVLSSPGLRIPPPPAYKVAAARMAAVVTPTAGFPNGLDPHGISRDPEVVARYQDDPLVHDRISPSTFFAFTAAAGRGRDGATGLRVPTLLVHGMADRLVDPAGSVAFAAAAPAGLVRFVPFAHGAHELFNDLDRDAAIAAVRDWLRDRGIR